MKQEQFKMKNSDHRLAEALFNLDLLTTIFSSLEHDAPGSLFNAALVSKSFKGPALDCLWRSLDSFIPLLMLLPGLELDGSLYHFSGNMNLSSFPEYAKRIRSITLPVVKEETTFSGQVFSRLGKQLAGSSLLPGLRKIKIEDLDTMASTLLPMLFSPSLSTLEFRKESLSRLHLKHSLFPSLQTDLPSVKRLVLEHGSRSFHLPDTIPKMLLGLIGLESLVIKLPSTCFTPNYLADVARNMPHLKDLSLDINYGHTSSTSTFNGRNISQLVCPTAPAMTKSSFPSLRSLHLTLADSNTCHFNTSVAICSGFPPTFLEHLTSITLLVSSPISSLADLIQCLSRSPNIKRIELTQRAEHVSAAVPLDVVLSIFDLKTVEELILDVGMLKFVTQGQGQTSLQRLIDTAFTDKPRLFRKLVVPSKSTYPFRIRDLEYISKNALGLESLSLAVNSSLESFKNEVRFDRFVHKSSTLRHLKISDVRPAKDFTMMEHSNIAQYLDAIFPNLESMKPYRDSRGVGGEHADNWVFIEHLRKKAKLLRILLTSV